MSKECQSSKTTILDICPGPATHESLIVGRLMTKSLPPFTKGPAFRGIWQRGVRGDFLKHVSSLL